MVAKRRYAYSRSPIGWPSLLVAVLWVGLWAIWPGWRRLPSDSVRRREGGLALYHAAIGDWYVPFTLNGASDHAAFEDGVRGGVEELLELTPRAPRYLVSDEVVPASPTVPASGARGVLPAGLRPMRVPTGPGGPHKAETGLLAMRLRVHTTGALKEQGFQIPDLTMETIRHDATAWSAVLHVETDQSGRVEHVFLERGTGDRPADTRLMGAVQRGVASRPGGAARGRVKVSFGLQWVPEN